MFIQKAGEKSKTVIMNGAIILSGAITGQAGRVSQSGHVLEIWAANNISFLPNFVHFQFRIFVTYKSNIKTSLLNISGGIVVSYDYPYSNIAFTKSTTRIDELRP